MMHSSSSSTQRAAAAASQRWWWHLWRQPRQQHPCCVNAETTTLLSAAGTQSIRLILRIGDASLFRNVLFLPASNSGLEGRWRLSLLLLLRWYGEFNNVLQLNGKNRRAVEKYCEHNY